ncbi:MAG TPA: phosphate signaling complex protein PhoU [Candidatus Binatia bacterium]|jgi:phosphate transport system protein|nr:phosphate signaling complex protein PhoU [Candidatus Binatia bacterium]HME60262.1 phosphate signaling complex protein PhoU [Candidatus Binatia bacterium]
MPTEHTDKRYEEELKKLREEILYMGGLVEDQIQKSVKSLVDRDSDLATVIIERDHEVNRLDVEIDELCIKLLALHQPAGRDLRFITTGLKITTDLERIGDMAVNICERALELNQEPQLKPYIDIPRMARISQRMIRESLDAFVREDTELALKVCRDDDEVDQLNAQIFRETLTFMLENAQTISRATKISSISKYLERIADHATNIAEMVIFMVKGKSIRHMKVLPPSL